MWDKFDLRIPFKDEFVSRTSDQDKKKCGAVESKHYSFPMNERVCFVGGQKQVREVSTSSWDSLPSSLSKAAIGFFPQGNGFDHWPHIRVKCSPAKILQGHNVYGSENPVHGVLQMLSYVDMAFPDVYAHLDIQAAEIYYTDVTYSGRVPSQYFRDSIFRLCEGLAHSNQKVFRDSGYLKLGAGQERSSQKIYEKYQELMSDLAEAKRTRSVERVKILSDKKLQDFAMDLMRFEATAGRRFYEENGIPTNLWEFFKFEQWFLKTHNEPLSRHIWNKIFGKTLKSLEGQTMKNVDDGVIKTKVYAKFTRIKDNGKVCQRLANAVWNTYRDIKYEGYKAKVKDNNKTFYRNVNHLEQLGLSRAFLKSLDPMKPDTNVVPIVQLINIDFENQRPHDFVEPTCGFDDDRLMLKLVS